MSRELLCLIMRGIFLGGFFFFSLPFAHLTAEPPSENLPINSPASNDLQDAEVEADKYLREIEKTWLQGISQEAKKKNGGEVEATPGQLPEGKNGESIFRNEAQPPSNLFSPDNNQESIGDQSLLSLLVRLLLMMAVVLGGFYLLFRFLRKKSGISFAARHDLLTVIASINVPHPSASGKILQIVDLAGTLLLISVADAGIRLVSKIEDKPTIEKIRIWQSQNSDSRPRTHRDSTFSLFNQLFKTKKWQRRPFWDFFHDKDHEATESQSLDPFSLPSSQPEQAFADLIPELHETESIAEDEQRKNPIQRQGSKKADSRVANQGNSSLATAQMASHQRKNRRKAKKNDPDQSFISPADSTVIPGRLNALLLEQRRRLSAMSRKRDEFRDEIVERQENLNFE